MKWVAIATHLHLVHITINTIIGDGVLLSCLHKTLDFKNSYKIIGRDLGLHI